MSMENYEEVHIALLGKQFAQTGGRMGSLKTYDHAAGKICMEVDEATGVIRAFKKIGSTRVYDDIPEAVDAIVAELYEIAGGAPEQDSEPEPEAIDRDVPEPKPLQKENIPNKAPTNGVLSIIDDVVGNDVLEIFGPTGSCKSKFSLHVAREYVKAGKKVYYLDTERNLTEDDIKSLKGCTYKYTPDINEIEKLTRNLPKVDVVIIDSIGFPVLTTYARLNMKQKGDALLKMIAIFGDLKLWAYHNNGIAVVTNQPESEFNKGQGHVLRPFGDKSQFAAKEIWWLDPKTKSEKLTTSNITAFRSRSMGMKTHIAKIEVTSEGVRVV